METTGSSTTPATASTPVTAPDQPQSGPAVLLPLRLHDFRLVFAGESVSLIGDQFHFIALAWLALQLTGSGVALGTVLMAAAIPRAAFMLLGGAMSDRVSPRSLMIISNALRAAVVAVVAVLVLTGNAQLWQLYVLAAVFGVVDAFFHPALNTIVPMLVSERLLPPANALVQVMQQLSALIGPAVAGLIIAAITTGPAFAIDAASFVVATVCLLFVRGGRRPAAREEDGPREGVLGTIGSGLAYAWRDSAVRAIVLLTAAFNFAFTGPVSVGLPYLAKERFAGGPAEFGLMLSMFGAGALAGALLAGSLRHVPRLGLLVLLIAAGLGVGLALIGNAPSLWIVDAAILVIGLGAGFLNVRVIAWLQARTDEAFRGRVMSLVMLGGVGLAPVSLAISGLIIDLGAVTLLFSVAGAIVVAAVLAGFYSGVPAQMTDEVEA
ncbi:MAG TPA: MFS transporter [Candidatus Limnocylindria bacterium]|jgi:MFS family permease